MAAIWPTRLFEQICLFLRLTNISARSYPVNRPGSMAGATRAAVTKQ
jgi:hypothetical protein